MGSNVYVLMSYNSKKRIFWTRENRVGLFVLYIPRPITLTPHIRILLSALTLRRSKLTQDSILGDIEKRFQCTGYS